MPAQELVELLSGIRVGATPFPAPYITPSPRHVYTDPLERDGRMLMSNAVTNVDDTRHLTNRRLRHHWHGNLPQSSRDFQEYNNRLQT